MGEDGGSGNVQNSMSAERLFADAAIYPFNFNVN
jgi:hypothetical protein